MSFPKGARVVLLQDLYAAGGPITWGERMKRKTEARRVRANDAADSEQREQGYDGAPLGLKPLDDGHGVSPSGVFPAPGSAASFACGSGDWMAMPSVSS